mgnify:CR=1 FL=1
MIRGDMSVTEFGMVLWNNKIKVGLLFLAVVFGPGLYTDWEKKSALDKLEANRTSVDMDASFAGMTLMNAWTECAAIGIVNDMERCAAYEGRLLQEMGAPMLARTAIQQRDSYYTNCRRFYADQYCAQLLQRSFALSARKRSPTE